MDRLFVAIELIEDELTPKARKLIGIIKCISDDVNYLDYSKWSDWEYDDSEYGLEAYVREQLKDYLKKGEK